MKKILLIALLVLLPLSVYAAPQAMNADELDAMTAQEGVKITFGDADGGAGGLVIKQAAADTAWTNKDVDGDTIVETGILMEVTQQDNIITITDSLTIEAKKFDVNFTPLKVDDGQGNMIDNPNYVADSNFVDSVVIGLPTVKKVAGSGRTDIFIFSENHEAKEIGGDTFTKEQVAAMNTSFNLADGATPQDYQLGSMYNSGGHTTIAGGTIIISAIK